MRNTREVSAIPPARARQAAPGAPGAFPPNSAAPRLTDPASPPVAPQARDSRAAAVAAEAALEERALHDAENGRGADRGYEGQIEVGAGEDGYLPGSLAESSDTHRRGDAHKSIGSVDSDNSMTPLMVTKSSTTTRNGVGGGERGPRRGPRSAVDDQSDKKQMKAALDIQQVGTAAKMVQHLVGRQHSTPVPVFKPPAETASNCISSNRFQVVL